MSGGIEVERLTKRFRSFTAVDRVSFTAADGKITALLGPSGSGKSTVLRTIAGLERPTAGRITIAGEDQTDTSVQDRRVGFVFQHYALFRHMTVRQNIAFGLSVQKVGKTEMARRVDELLELVHLAPFADRYPHHLSGGQRQRVALARALAPHPTVLLLDEPFGALDARVREDLRHWLDELHREIGVTSLFVTHDQEEALELANRIVVMNEGRVEQIGTPTEIYNEPATPFVAGFIGASNVLHGHVVDGHVQFGDQRVAGADHLEDGTPARAFVRPHDVRLNGGVSSVGSVRATVERIVTLGWLCRVVLRLPDEQVLTAELPNDELEGVELGSIVDVDLRRAKAFEVTDVDAPAVDDVPLPA
jgi:sulfate/thiosulfate transport system ATP-binding protein